jgi:hypothetical protein
VSFEFDVELSVALVLWDKTDDIYRDRIETKNTWTVVCICLQEDFEALGEVKKRFW